MHFGAVPTPTPRSWVVRHGNGVDPEEDEAVERNRHVRQRCSSNGRLSTQAQLVDHVRTWQC